MDNEAQSLDMMVPQMEKMYMEDEDDATPWIHQDGEVGHMEAPTSTTPTSHERDYKGNNIGVDDAMIPLVDMMTCDDVHAMDDTFDITYDSFIFPCDDLPSHNVDHVELFDCDAISIDMPCYRYFVYPLIACDMPNNFSSTCFACNDDINANCVVTNLMNNCSLPMFVDNHAISLNVYYHECSPISPIVACNKMNNCYFTCFACNNTHHMVHNEIAPIAFSNFGDFDYCHDKHVPMYSLHFHHAYCNSLLDANGDMQRRRCIMMDDVFIYHAHTYFLWSIVCVGTRKIKSTLIEHELTK
jgi:hypothetical protein